MQAHTPKPYVRLTHPEWARNATLYQINVRQFSAAGTFKAAEAELPRLQQLGVDILWLMPIHPIGQSKRKGTLGSPYAVRDYYAVNPEFGTLNDLKSFVAEAHAHGMYVILDWVANHTAWDNALVREHPEWYERDWDGNFRPTPWWDWSDIINFDYQHEPLRRYMSDAMQYWVREADIDGYRCDVAGFVPVDFWNTVREQLDAIKPVFMLAEWESRDLHAEAFDATYAWTWFDAVHNLVTGKGTMDALYVYYSWNESAFPADAYRMTFVSNHDKNAWDGTQFEMFGDGLPGAIVLSVVGEGMPLIYNGQEAGNPKRLAFFDKDPIDWRQHPIGTLYQQLFALKHRHPALGNGSDGGRMVPVPNTQAAAVLSFTRTRNGQTVFAVINFSDALQQVRFTDGPFAGDYTDAFAGDARVFSADDNALTLAPWEWRVFVTR
ncbi:MAG: alpha-amylase family glycosyl hydrolase [Pseudomonadota bacterium]